jgi:methionyl-tRNA synthetase
MSTFYISTAIDFVNSRPHLGTAYEKITADVIARYKRLSGVETRFLMGNDEHSQNVYQRAQEEGLEPLAFCDKMEEVFRSVWRRLNISFDDFIRTTEERHRLGVIALVQKIADAGDLYEGAYEGWYCVSCEAFKQEKDLVDGNCPIHHRPPQWIKEKNYFFRLSKFQQPLLDHYAAHPEFLEPKIRRNEILRFLESGPEDISMSRTGQSWGIPLPNDPGSVVYVWVDALINYISAVGFGWDEGLREKWWPADLHVIGKDITRFHCVIWPAMLMSAGLPLPRQVFGHGWVHWKGQKMSKSLGTVVDPLEAADRLGPDPLRLYLTKEIGYGNDGDFTWDRFEDRYNVDLANNFGNLVSRLASMAHRYRDGRLVAPTGTPGRLANRASSVVATYRAAMDRFAIHDGASSAFDLIDATNEFIADVQPWAVAKDPARSDELDQQLFDISEAIRIAALLLLPVMPQSCAEVLRRVGETRDVGSLRLDQDGIWMTTGDRVIVKGDPLWPRIEVKKDLSRPSLSSRARPKAEDKMTEQPKGEEANDLAAAAVTTQSGGQAPPATGASPTPTRGEAQKAAQVPDESPKISIDDFFKVELRVGRVVTAEAVPKSRKLIKIQLDTGDSERQVLAGLLGAYEPEQLVGRTVVFVANLKPAKLAGLESDGMILAASGPDGGQPVLLTVEDPDAAPPGAKVS